MLVEQARGGDLQAFDRLVERFQDAIYGAAYAMLGNPQDAQDVAQEAFTQAWREIHALREPDRFAGWLYRIAQNRCRNLLARRREQTVPIEQIDLVQSARREPTEEAIAGVVREAVDSLSEPNRLATVLFYLSGYRVDEIATMLDVPPGTIKRRLHDSRKRLREKMAGMVQQNLRADRPSNNRRFADIVTLFNAAWSGDASNAEAILSRTPALSGARDQRGWTPLHHAARHGYVEVVRRLIAAGADIQAKEAGWGWTPLHLAIEHQHAAVVEFLEAHGARLTLVAASALGRPDHVAALLNADPRLIDAHENGSGPLHWAAYYGHRDVAELLLLNGADVNARSWNTFNNTPLHCAVLGGHAAVVALLLQHGADVDAIDGYGGSPLHAVAKYPHEDRNGADSAVVKLLVAHGAAIDLANEDGETPMHWAATRGSKQVAKILLAHGARLDIYAAAGMGDVEGISHFLQSDPGLIDRRGPGELTPLQCAAYGNSLVAAEALVAHGARVNAWGGWFGGTALHLAAYQGHAEMVEWLVRHGADPRAKDGAGWTPLHQFRFPWWTPSTAHRLSIARCLLDHNADVDARNDNGETPLHLAAQAGDRGVAEALLTVGADPHRRDDQGRTPLHVAAAWTHYDVVTLLDQHAPAL